VRHIGSVWGVLVTLLYQQLVAMHAAFDGGYTYRMPPE
jgi:hypothetical protein